MIKNLLHGAAGIALLAAALSAQAADPAMHEAARAALRSGHYDRVVQLTSEIAKTEPATALNWYRMAIAAHRASDPSLARDALARAERADPSLAFASTPQRVEKLRADIREAMSTAPEATTTAVATPAPVVAPPGAADIDPIATAAAAVVGQQLQGMQQAIDRRLDKISQDLSAVNTNQAAAVKAANWERAVWIVGVLLAILVGAGGFTLILDRAAKARRENDLRKLAELPLQQLIAATRDANALLLQRLERHGHRETDLYTQVARTQPSLERESGRSGVSVSKLTEGKALADVAHPMQAKSKVLGRSDAADVHREATRRALSAAAGESRPKLAA